MKLPKYYQTCGHKLKIIRIDCEEHGGFDLDDGLIWIKRGLKGFALIDSFTHECFEVSLEVHYGRWANSGEMMFAFNHKKLVMVCQEVGRGIMDLLEINKEK